MTKYIIAIIAVLIIGGGTYVYVQSTQPDDAMMQDDDAMMHNDAMASTSDSVMEGEGAMMTDESTMMEEGTMMENGSYEVYSADKLARANKGDVVLFFRATWCPTCRALDADIRAHLGDIPSGLTILDVDYDTYTALKQKYGITYQHTFVQVDAQGNELAKWSGSPTLVDVVAHII